jgi:hypothetical protein
VVGVSLGETTWVHIGELFSSSGHVARMGEGRGVHRCWWGSLRERDHWGDPDVDGRIILRGNELSGSINAGNFLTSCKTS